MGESITGHAFLTRKPFTIGLWALATVSILIAGLIPAGALLIATSLDPSEMIMSGIEPWTDALIASGAFLALLGFTLFSLWLWHSLRFRVLGALLVLAQAAAVVWAWTWVYEDYL
jgi:hypothetical protein